MAKFQEIQKEIENLPENEFVKLRKWIAEKDWEKWDEKIKRDSDAGKLDFLIKEAKDEKEKGELKDL